MQQLLKEEVRLGVSDLQEALEENGSSALILRAKTQGTKKAKAAAKAREAETGILSQQGWGILMLLDLSDTASKRIRNLPPCLPCL